MLAILFLPDILAAWRGACVDKDQQKGRGKDDRPDDTRPVIGRRSAYIVRCPRTGTIAQRGPMLCTLPHCLNSSGTAMMPRTLPHTPLRKIVPPSCLGGHITWQVKRCKDSL